MYKHGNTQQISVRLLDPSIRNTVLVACLVSILSGCVSFPHAVRGPEAASRKVDVVLEDADNISATWGSLFNRIQLKAPVECCLPPKILFAPVTKKDGKEKLGAFAIIHGPDNSKVTVHWWREVGKPVEYTYSSTGGSKLNARWASGRVLRIEDGGASKYVRIRYDDDDPYYNELP